MRKKHNGKEQLVVFRQEGLKGTKTSKIFWPTQTTQIQDTSGLL